ncbi:MAG: peptidase MA family metallohydrolase, partial [Dehalococcoidales bacterium]|nr:peptidase MA family metallohydrolase [Dehalococcoidales bacterium]
VRNYGQSQMLEMLNAFSQGSNYDDALTEVYGFDMDGLDALWREYVTRQYQPAPVTTGVSPVIITSSTRLAGKLLPDLWPAVLSLLNGRTGEKVIYNP